MSNKKEWVNNFAKMWCTKEDNKKYFLSMPLAEPVTIKLQRKKGDDFVVEEVTLVPIVNDKGYSSVSFKMDKVRPFTTKEGKEVIPPSSLKQTLSVSPGSQGQPYEGRSNSKEDEEEIDF